MTNQPTLSEMFDNPSDLRGANGCNKNMNRLFAEWLSEHEHQNSRLGDCARAVRDMGIKPTDKEFPNWRDYESISNP